MCLNDSWTDRPFLVPVKEMRRNRDGRNRIVVYRCLVNSGRYTSRTPESKGLVRCGTGD